jgi:periplasmic protein CpxP/Spy
MRGRGGPSIEMMTTNLSLTAEQVPKVKAVLDAQRQKMTELRGDSNLSQEDRRTKMQEMRTDMTAKMKEILTPEQFAKFEKMGPGMRGNRPPGGGRPSGAGEPPAGDKPPQN